MSLISKNISNIGQYFKCKSKRFSCIIKTFNKFMDIKLNIKICYDENQFVNAVNEVF